MKYIFSIMLLIAFTAAAITGNGDSLTKAILDSPAEAVELCIYLCGGMCFWGGLMRAAEKSGITDIIAAVFARLLGGLFSDLNKNGRAFKAICMNITANLLGLGNAATPLGIEAMQAMKEEEKAEEEATPSMIMFTVLNTASLTLIPSTALSLRIKYGSSDPAGIMPAVWITSAAALAAAVIAAKTFGSLAAKSKPSRQTDPPETRNKPTDRTGE